MGEIGAGAYFTMEEHQNVKYRTSRQVVNYIGGAPPDARAYSVLFACASPSGIVYISLVVLRQM